MTTLDISTLEYLLNYWKENPKRKGACNDVRRLHTRIELSGNKAHTTILRLDGACALRRAEHIAFTNRVDSKTKGRIREWLKLIIGVPSVILILWGTCVVTSAFDPAYDQQTTITH